MVRKCEKRTEASRKMMQELRAKEKVPEIPSTSTSVPRRLVIDQASLGIF